MRPTRSMPQFGTRVGTPAMKRPMAARRGSNLPTNNHPARNGDDTVQSGKAKSERGEAKDEDSTIPEECGAPLGGGHRSDCPGRRGRVCAGVLCGKESRRAGKRV